MGDKTMITIGTGERNIGACKTASGRRVEPAAPAGDFIRLLRLKLSLTLARLSYAIAPRGTAMERAQVQALNQYLGGAIYG